MAEQPESGKIAVKEEAAPKRKRRGAIDPNNPRIANVDARVMVQRRRHPNWGGVRPNAGRPKKDDAYRAIVQARVHDNVAQMLQELGGAKFLRHLLEQVVERELERRSNGVSVTAEGRSQNFFDCPDEDLALGGILVKDPMKTWAVVMPDDSMKNAGIEKGDRLLVQVRKPLAGEIVAARRKRTWIVRRIVVENGRTYLKAEGDEAFEPIELQDKTRYLEHILYGVVTHVIKQIADPYPTTIEDLPGVDTAMLYLNEAEEELAKLGLK